MTWLGWCARSRICRRETKDSTRSWSQRSPSFPISAMPTERLYKNRLEEIAIARAEVGRILAQKTISGLRRLEAEAS